jgi:hypothetical protein
MQLFLDRAFQLYEHPLDALRAATAITRPGGVRVLGGRLGFEFPQSEYFYGNFTVKRLGDTGFGDLQDVAGNQVSHFIGEAYISLYSLYDSGQVFDGTAFIFGQEAIHPYQSPRQSNIDFDLGMIANSLARALNGGANPTRALVVAVTQIRNYDYETAHPRGSYGPYEFLHDYYYSPRWPLGQIPRPQ